MLHFQCTSVSDRQTEIIVQSEMPLHVLHAAGCNDTKEQNTRITEHFRETQTPEMVYSIQLLTKGNSGTFQRTVTQTMFFV